MQRVNGPDGEFAGVMLDAEESDQLVKVLKLTAGAATWKICGDLRRLVEKDRD